MILTFFEKQNIKPTESFFLPLYTEGIQWVLRLGNILRIWLKTHWELEGNIVGTHWEPGKNEKKKSQLRGFSFSPLLGSSYIRSVIAIRVSRTSNFLLFGNVDRTTSAGQTASFVSSVATFVRWRKTGVGKSFGSWPCCWCSFKVCWSQGFSRTQFKIEECNPRVWSATQILSGES
jgi:hypothetical protein